MFSEYLLIVPDATVTIEQACVEGIIVDHVNSVLIINWPIYISFNLL